MMNLYKSDAEAYEFSSLAVKEVYSYADALQTGYRQVKDTGLLTNNPPFYDGNGRTGRIINILYLVKEGLLDSPILYLSRYINRHKVEYYRLLLLL